MAVATSRTGAAGVRPPRAPRPSGPQGRRERPNYVSGVLTAIWLILVSGPILLMVKWAFQSRAEYQNEGSLSLPRSLTLANLLNVLDSGFARYMVNTAVVTVGSIVLMLALALPAAYAVVRSRGWFAGTAFRMFLVGLALPGQATIIPLYWMMDQLDLLDSLTAIILPTVAFQLPLVILILAGGLRDVSPELYEAMTVDGAGTFRIFWQLTLPLCRGTISTVAIFTGIGAWNGFLFPLILTTDPAKRVVTLGLWEFQGEHAIDVPGLMMGVMVSTLPIFLLYLFARRWLIAGLAGVGGK